MIEFIKRFFTDISFFTFVMLICVPIGLMVWAIWKDAKNAGLL